MDSFRPENVPRQIDEFDVGAVGNSLRVESLDVNCETERRCTGTLTKGYSAS